MNIIVTGASGLVGHACISNALRDPCNNIKAITRNSRTWEGIERIETFRSRDEVDRSLDYDLLIHAAAATPNNTHIDNIASTNRQIDGALFEFLSRCFVSSVVYLSTMAVYGDIKSSTISQNTVPNDPNGYGCSKLEGEELVKSSIVEKKLILRLPGVVGSGMPKVFFRKCYESLCNGQEITIRSRKSLFNNAVYVSDIYKTCMGFASNKGLPSKILNHHAGDIISLGEMLDSFARKLNVQPNICETDECGSPFIITNDGSEEELVTRNVLSIIDAYLETEISDA